MNKLLEEVAFLKDLNVNVIEIRENLDKLSQSLCKQSEQKIKEVENFEKQFERKTND
jgi:hypothetical protein|tara:strand:+ start:513 stop:683 length:171 start_codon:yes stop_codon:yes gene_type:complete